MNRHYKGKIGTVLQLITIAPLLILGFALMILGTRWFTDAMYDEVHRELENVANTAVILFDTAYPGDYALREETVEGKTAFRLFKGDADITEDYRLVDRLKEETGLEVTLFYLDTRIHTTIRNEDGMRFIGTGASKTVCTDVLENGEPHFYTNSTVYNSRYFSYYVPLYNSDHSVTGMLFVGRPVEDVSKSVQSCIYPLLAADFVVMICIAVLLLFFTRGLADDLQSLQHFFGNVSGGNLNAALPNNITGRNDELGAIGRAALSMQQSLRTMVEQDALTELYNRRSGSRRLTQIIEKSKTNGTSFSVCIADIDHFKRVNDTYGHDCGDVVLKSVAEQLRRHMHQNGFVARWGGEEFLLVFDRMDAQSAAESLNNLRAALLENVVDYEEYHLRITMTFGLTDGVGKDIVQLLREADDRLYRGKESGRNQVVWTDEEDPASGDPAPGDPAPGDPASGDPAPDDSTSADTARNCGS